MRPLQAVLLVPFILAACADGEVHVESDTSWEGTVEGIGAVEGTGDRIFEVTVGDDTCWRLTKTGPNGVLRAYGRTKSLFGTDITDDATTTRAGGTVAGCL
jgi:hypothetical protein